MNWRERITSNPDICHGKACVRGTRVMVAIILDSLADGLNTEEILAEYPSLCVEDIRAAIGFAADLAKTRFIPLAG